MGCMDLRQWIELLEREGELHRIKAQVDWDCEIGTISRRVLEKQGPALLFENIKGHEKTRGRRVFCGGIGTRARLNLALGFPKDATNGQIQPYPSAARLIVKNATAIVIIPASEMSVECPELRLTAFTHRGDYGLTAPNFWAGDTEPTVFEPLDQVCI